MLTEGAKAPSILPGGCMRLFLWAASALLWLAVGGAMVTQVYWGWEPCVMCVEIRAGLVGMALALGVAAVVPFAWMRKGFVALSLLSGGWACKVGGELFALEQGWVDSFGCSPFARFPARIPLHEWVPVVFQPQGICGDSPKSLVGVPLSIWPIVIVLVAIIILARRRRDI